MTDLKTTQEVSASALDGTELVRIVQGGNNAAATTAQFKTFSSISFSPWTSYNALITPSAGSITTQTSASAYLLMGKTVFYRISILLVNVGTASGNMTLNFPVLPSATQIAIGRQTNVTGHVTATEIQLGTLVSSTLTDYSGVAVTSFVNNSLFEFNGVYEAL